MARYIDADKLIKRLQVDFDKQGKKSDDMAFRGEAELSVKYNHGQYCYLNAIEQVKDAPTADVVPKSEVDNLKMQFEALDRECDRLEKAESEKHDKFIEAKAEVAREIFEEIDKRFEALLKFYPCNGEFEDAKSFVDFHWKHIRHSIMCDYDADLKKKYTESEND